MASMGTVVRPSVIGFYSGDAYSSNNNKCSAVAEMSDRLAIIDMDRKLAAVPFWGGGARSSSNIV